MYKETFAGLVLIVLLLLIANPYHFWMPTMLHLMVVAALLVAFGFFAAVILRERARDEREGANRMYADRAAFLLGTLILILGIVYQILMQMLDIWLPLTLVGMVLAKLVSHAYSDRYR